MGHRLSKIYTRTGDDGTTGLGDGSRVPKTHGRIEAYGTVDEANSAIGAILAVPNLPPTVAAALTKIQHELFDLGGELAVPGYRAILDSHIEQLEQCLDGFN
ncbi:MAG: ATP:cob(I)alamin adenosyltransferase, partial [Steroidobacteraceae bacterium]